MKRNDNKENSHTFQTVEEIATKLSTKIVLKHSRVKALLRLKGLKELVKVVPGEGVCVEGVSESKSATKTKTK